jgi:hypothetical protein
MTATVIWEALAWLGTEHLVLRSGPDDVDADGMVIALDGRPLRLHYRLHCDPRWAARELTIEESGSAAAMTFRSDGAGRWTDGEGRALDDLAGCIDVDIAATPFTNTLPIRRLGLRVGEACDIRVLYVTVPELTVHAVDQRYRCLAADGAGATYRYESGSFMADILVDTDGLVVDYPGLWRRLSPPAGG